jgi:hypothetical protein
MSTQTIAVTVIADPGTEFVISDSQRLRIQSGAGQRHFKLPPGIYKARFMAGGLSHDELFEVDEQPVTLHAPTLEIASPVPLTGTSTTHEYHEHPARQLARLPPVTLGKGSEIAVLVRDSRKQWNVGPPSEPWRGVLLQSLAGVTEYNFATDGLRDGDRGFAAVRIEVEPGTFLLTRWREKASAWQLPVTATAGWRTTVYLDCTGEDGARQPDLHGASVIISRLQDEFLPEDPVLKLAELAKLALQKGRASVDAAALSGMMSQKFTYPMLGILAAHVLLLEPKPDLATLKIVLANLGKLIPGHPDVLALHCGLSRHEPVQALEHAALSGPPMLRSSWEMLVDASAKYPHLMPLDAEWLQYACALSGSQVWLVWQRPRSEQSGGTFFTKPGMFTPRVQSNENERRNPNQLAAIWSPFHDALKDPSLARNPLQSAVRRSLLSFLDERSESPDAVLTLEALARDLRVPSGLVVQAANALLVNVRGRVPEMELMEAAEADLPPEETPPAAAGA